MACSHNYIPLDRLVDGHLWKKAMDSLLPRSKGIDESHSPPMMDPSAPRYRVRGVSFLIVTITPSPPLDDLI